MVDFSTTYMGLALRNPLVVASSGLTGTLQGVVKCAEAGAGAIVLKSLFEEQIAAEIGALSRYADYAGHGEAEEYLQGYGMELGPRDYLQLVRDAKRAVTVPIIPSLNCISNRRWADYAGQLEAAGADAIELNIALMPTRATQTGAAILELYCQILHAVKSQVKIPVAVKIGPYFTSLGHFAERLTRDRAQGHEFTVGWCGPGSGETKIVWQGADALVLFNRFYRFDIDIDRLQLVAASPFSTPGDIHVALRWVSLLAGRIDADIAAATGIHEGRDVVKQLLAGATVVQMASTLYQNGLGRMGEILTELRGWMEKHGFTRLDEFLGRLSQARSDHPENHERLQYLKLLGGDR